MPMLIRCDPRSHVKPWFEKGWRVFIEAPATGFQAASGPRRRYRVKVVEQRRTRDPGAEFSGQGDHVGRFSPSIFSKQFFESSGGEEHQHAKGGVTGRIAPGMVHAFADGDGRTGTDRRPTVSIRAEP